MKLPLLRSISALLALGLVTVATAALETQVASVPARIQANGDAVAPGTSQLLVSLRLGSPNCVLPDGSWVYHGYEVQIGPDLRKAGSLVIRFAGNRVATLHVADDATIQALRRALHAMPDRLLAETRQRR